MNSQSVTYQRALQEAMERRDIEQMKLNTGKKLYRLSDSPKDVADIEGLNVIINKNLMYQATINETIGEMITVEGALQHFTEKVENVRLLAIEASKHANYDKLPVVGQQVLQQLTDMVQIANQNFNGRFSFAGTRNTPASIANLGLGSSDVPFELVQEAATPNNPSGLRVVFKGNNEDRVINRSETATEIVNFKASNAFGGEGTRIFESAIRIYNVLTFKADGQPRQDNEVFSIPEQRQLQDLVRQVSNDLERLTEETARTGYRRVRLESLSEQIDFENTRLKELRSENEDTNIPEAILNLKREETALTYSLQVGARLFQQSLFDFLR